MSDQNHDEKRHFSRIPFDGGARLNCGGEHWTTTLLDVSLKGALVSRPAGWEGAMGAQCNVELLLGSGEQAVIVMETTVVHAGESRLGLRCDHIDLDSISHLKRLVQLNVGDDSTLERELLELTGFAPH